MAASDIASANTPKGTKEKRKFAPTDHSGRQLREFSPQTYFGGGMFAQDIQNYQEHKDWMTGFSNMDDIQPLYPGLYVLGAVSSLGKTTFVLQMADNLAESGKHVLFFSLEQTGFELFSKSLARRVYQANPSLANSPTSAEIRCGTVSDRPEVEEQIEAYTNDVADRLTVLECNFGITVAEIREKVANYIEHVGVQPIVIIDYLQIIAPPSENSTSKSSNKDNIDNIVHTLKAMQSDFQLVVIVISSFNRQSYTLVSLDSFKESGGIEYTADVLWGLQLGTGTDATPERERKQAIKDALKQNPRLIKLVYLKNRYGQSNENVKFKYYPKFDLFEPDF